MGGVDYQMELEELDRESKLPLEELKRKYFMTDESEEDIASVRSSWVRPVSVRVGSSFFAL